MVTLETAHFHVHVRVENRALGVEAAADAETAYAALAAPLPPPGIPSRAIVGDNADYTNGFTIEHPLPHGVRLLTRSTGYVAEPAPRPPAWKRPTS